MKDPPQASRAYEKRWATVNRLGADAVREASTSSAAPVIQSYRATAALEYTIEARRDLPVKIGPPR